MKKILIVIPPVSRAFGQYRMDYCDCIPVSELYIATMLENEGHKCRVYWPDYDYPFRKKKNVWKELIEVITKFSPDILGIGFTTEEYNSAKKVIELTKGVREGIVTIAGGHHPTALPEKTMEEIPLLDIIIKGEAEYIIIDVLKAVNNEFSISDIKGITYRERDVIISTPNKEPIQILDDLPFPKRNLILNLGFKFSQLVQPIVVQRDCSYNCSICSDTISKGKVRFRSPQNVINEIEYLYEKYLIVNFRFVASTFTVNENWVKEICNLIIKRKLKISWACETRVDRVNYELIKIMKNAGCCHIFFGVESGSKKILNYFKKSFNIKDINKAVRILKDIGGMYIRVAFLLGYPKETPETLTMTKKLISSLPYESAYISLLLPYPGTQICEELVKNGKLISKNWDKYNSFKNNFLIKIDSGLQKEYLLQKYYEI